MSTVEKACLHVGCGAPNPKKLPDFFRQSDWREIRFDIDPSVQPDIIGTMTDMSAVESGSMDALYSSHNVEHLYDHEVPLAFAEFLRVLKPGGFAVITCPDLQSIGQLLADGKLEEAAYTAPAGPITPLDILYGYRPSIARGNHFMAHRTGYTGTTLGQRLHRAGFAKVTVSKGEQFDLWARADKAA
ncbi:methyltransferase domain-containing protein [Aureimonas sp. AU12]|uniref:class I SAM-dependent methyltransferase n=1 Tax=Aureimonas sp. AU12 TaxID=1638161 RepID=UPI001FCDEF98|nr:methyltransferase domain-containing protein [Aureimonas sp. AU12]